MSAASLHFFCDGKTILKPVGQIGKALSSPDQELYLGRRKELEAAQGRVREELKSEKETRRDEKEEAGRLAVQPYCLQVARADGPVQEGD